jgi:aspartate/methionine/tyrosine aminotransferase
MLDEALAAEAMPHIDRILERNNKIVRENWKLLNTWLSKEPLLEWVKPSAGSVAFMKQHTGFSSKKLCLELIRKRSTFLVPGECFEHPDHIRIGYGNNKELLESGLEQVSDFLSNL